MKDFNIFEYHKSFEEYAQYVNDDTLKGEAKLLEISINEDVDKATKDTIKLIEEGKLPNHERMEIVLLLAAVVASKAKRYNEVIHNERF